MPGRVFLCSVMLLVYLVASSQEDSTRHRLQLKVGSGDNLQLNNARLLRQLDSLLHPELRIGGYVSTYFAHYDDEIQGSNGFVQFPTLAPRNDQFSLNMALISMEYRSRNLRSNLSFHYGDIPESSWPATFNLIQEANAGFRIKGNWWFDAGFFKTHIGLGSFQPRENITSSMSIPDFYDPYFLSGAKLTYYASKKVSLQACIFNGYNEYIDNNKNKALDFTANYSPSDNLSFTYNFLTCDDTPDSIPTKHQRYYQNFYATLVHNRWIFGLDVNFGLQENSLKKDMTKIASMYAATFVTKYNIGSRTGVYSRAEYFSDPNDILSGALDIGRYIGGITAGAEYKPQKTVALSAEWRILQADKLIFKQGRYMINQRNEFIVCLDLWF